MAYLFQYHSHKGRKDFSKGSRFKIGLEIEKEDNIIDEYNATTVLNKTGWVLEHDCSLNYDIGFEAISPILPLMGHRGSLKYDSILKDSIESVKWAVNAKATSNCGGHIHLSDTMRKPKKLLEVFKGYMPLFYLMYPKRVGNRFCKVKSAAAYIGGGHDAFSLHGNTLEIRLFPSPISMSQVLWRIDLLRYILQHPKDNVEAVTEEIVEEKELYKLLRKRMQMKTVLNIVAKMEATAKKYDNLDYTKDLSVDKLLAKYSKYNVVKGVPSKKGKRLNSFEDCKKGMKVTGTLGFGDYTIKDGTIQIVQVSSTEVRAIVCQNKLRGFHISNRLGYRYSYWIFSKGGSSEEGVDLYELIEE